MPPIPLDADIPVSWEYLLPREFDQRLQANPTVYLPLGLCEPHGHVAPFGLDTLKAEYLCHQGARRFGGIVAPTMAYHIHESGYHGPWLDEVIGRRNPRLAALPPHVVLETFLYQLRAFRNAGFKAVVAISGHAGGNQEDLRLVADAFKAAYAMNIFVCADPELVADRFAADHAGRYEVSQLMAIDPGLVDLDRAPSANDPDLGRLGQNHDAAEATVEMGNDILEAQLGRIGEIARGFAMDIGTEGHIAFEDIEPIWAELLSKRASWRTLNP